MNTQTTLLRPLMLTCALLAALGTTGTARAQATIDHNKALAGNVTPGDAPGYPITLTRPGHYRLMGNLTVPAGSHGIEIKADDITLDLNGFTVAGPGNCAWSTGNASGVITCSGNAAGCGIVASGGYAVVRNGTVRGFGNGMVVDSGSLLENLKITHNAFDGLLFNFTEAGPSIAHRLVVAYNGRDGVTGDYFRLRDVSASRNGRHGVAGDGHVEGGYAFANKGLGFSGVTLSGSFLDRNGQTNRGAARSAGHNGDGAGIY